MSVCLVCLSPIFCVAIYLFLSSAFLCFCLYFLFLSTSLLSIFSFFLLPSPVPVFSLPPLLSQVSSLSLCLSCVHVSVFSFSSRLSPLSICSLSRSLWPVSSCLVFLFALLASDCLCLFSLFLRAFHTVALFSCLQVELLCHCCLSLMHWLLSSFPFILSLKFCLCILWMFWAAICNLCGFFGGSFSCTKH